MGFVRSWAEKTDIPVGRFLPWIGIGTSKFHNWTQRYGKVHEHNAWVPRDPWFTDPAKEANRRLRRRPGRSEDGRRAEPAWLPTGPPSLSDDAIEQAIEDDPRALVPRVEKQGKMAQNQQKRPLAIFSQVALSGGAGN